MAAMGLTSFRFAFAALYVARDALRIVSSTNERLAQALPCLPLHAFSISPLPARRGAKPRVVALGDKSLAAGCTRSLGMGTSPPVVGPPRAFGAAHEMLANLPPPGPMQRPTALLARSRRSPLQIVKPTLTLAALSADAARRPVAVDKAVTGLDTPNRLSGSELAFADVALHARVTDKTD
jgi:hypothetical protein